MKYDNTRKCWGKFLEVTQWTMRTVLPLLEQSLEKDVSQFLHPQVQSTLCLGQENIYVSAETQGFHEQLSTHPLPNAELFWRLLGAQGG